MNARWACGVRKLISDSELDDLQAKPSLRTPQAAERRPPCLRPLIGRDFFWNDFLGCLALKVGAGPLGLASTTKRADAEVNRDEQQQKPEGQQHAASDPTLHSAAGRRCHRQNNRPDQAQK